MSNIRELLVKEFENRLGELVSPNSIIDTLNVRINLINEEGKETIDALSDVRMEIAYSKFPRKETVAHLIKELCDLQYVLSGTVTSLGLEDIFEEAYRRVHENNMTKVSGSIRIVNGKLMKPDDFKQVELGDLVKDVWSTN
jgi:predicted HAD superfamily Cof-like phosphohydrolase